MATITKPSFKKATSEQDLFLQLKQEVHSRVQALDNRRHVIKTKAILFPLLYLSAYAAALAWGANVWVLYSCYLLLGFFLLLNFLNLIHDAVHNTLFEQKWLNKVYVYFFDLMGANSYIWKIRHIRLHHNYPNVMGWDSDFEQSPMARVFPHARFSPFHRYQHLYLPLVYPLYLFNWLLVRDFKDFFRKKNLVWKVTTIPTAEYIKLFVFKGFFFIYILVLPALLLPVSRGQMLAAFLIMMFTASITSLLVLLSPHATPASAFPLPNSQGVLPNSWFMHQLVTTNDVSGDNWFTRFFMGSFNYHIAHHLFPHIHHVYYPEVTAILVKFARKNKLPYRSYPLFTSLRNHYRLLKANAVADNLFEETM